MARAIGATGSRKGCGMRLVNELRQAIGESASLSDATTHVGSFLAQYRAIESEAWDRLMDAVSACHNVRHHTDADGEGCERCRLIARKNALVEMFAILTNESAEAVYERATDDLIARHETASQDGGFRYGVETPKPRAS